MSDISTMPARSVTISLGRALVAGAALLSLGVAIGLVLGESSAPSVAASLLNRADDATPPLLPIRSAARSRSAPVRSSRAGH
jgi:hypothetical protein